MEKCTFYTLLYVDLENKSLSHNGVSGAFDTQIKIFIGCAENLNKSLLRFGYKLVVLTNNKSYVEERSSGLDCVEIPFHLNAPKEIGFFASHHKIDAYKYLSKIPGYSILMDNDILCINKMPQSLVNLVELEIPIYYDISFESFFAYGVDGLIKDKEAVSNMKSTGLWTGGEFIGGTGAFYADLFDTIDRFKDYYFANYKTLIHQTDEMLIAPAVEYLLQQKKYYICDAGRLRIITRYWSAKPRFPQAPFDACKENFLIHLPSDKKFIASLERVDNIVEAYEAYLGNKKEPILPEFVRLPIYKVKQSVRKLLNKMS